MSVTLANRKDPYTRIQTIGAFYSPENQSVQRCTYDVDLGKTKKADLCQT